MNKITTVFLASLALGGLTSGAFAQGANDGAALGFVPTAAQAGATPPALNAPAEPNSINVPVTVAEGGRMALPPGPTASPVGPGSGMTFALDVPADVEVSLATLEINRGQPASAGGGYSTASGPEADRDGVPPVLGVDLSTQGAGSIGLTPVQTQTVLGQ